MPRNTTRLLTLVLLTLLSVLPASTGVARPAQTISVYLPMTGTGLYPATVLGTEVATVAPGSGLEEIRPSWVRRNALLWSEVEPRRGSYNWDAPSVRSLEAELIQLSALNIEPILGVRSSPAWARAPGSGDCGPIVPDHYADFARFMRAAVERYSRPPYNVRYWEVGNEPDAPVSSGQMPYGCWGQTDDPYTHQAKHNNSGSNSNW